MNRLVLVVAAAALLGLCDGRASNINRTKLLKDINVDSEKEIQTKRPVKYFVNITNKPSVEMKHYGDGMVELKCSVIGSPAPSVQWLRNDIPIKEYEKEPAAVTHGGIIARLNSTLLVTPSDHYEDVYSCLATAGPKTQIAKTSVYTLDKNPDLSERYKLLPLRPRIVSFYALFLDTIGKDVVLPCKAKGHPRPKVSWTDNEENTIEKNARFRILRSGDLLIKDLHWSDMGEFSCTASNIFGSATSNTFLYPVAK